VERDQDDSQAHSDLGRGMTNISNLVFLFHRSCSSPLVLLGRNLAQTVFTTIVFAFSIAYTKVVNHLNCTQ
jgi:hypothetical protein